MAFLIAYREPARAARFERPHRLDLLGAALLVSATVVAASGPELGRHPLPLGLAADPRALRRLPLLWGLFALRMRWRPEPLIPPGVLHNPVVRMGVLAACFGMGTYIGLTIYLPVYFEAVRGLSASLSGLALIPLMAGTVVGATLSGQTMARVKHYKRLPTVGLMVAMTAMGVLFLLWRGLSG